MPIGWEKVYKDGLWNDVTSCVELSEILKLTQNKDERIIDIGCSYGRITKPLAELGFYVTAVDVVEDPLKVLRNKLIDLPNVNILRCKSTQLPFSENLFNGCIAVNSIYHGLYKDVTESIYEIERVLKNNGWFYGTFLSKHDSKYAKGVALEKNTYLSEEGADPGVPHWFASEEDLTRLFAYWNIYELRHDVYDNGPTKSAHWTVIGRIQK